MLSLYNKYFVIVLVCSAITFRSIIVHLSGFLLKKYDYGRQFAQGKLEFGFRIFKIRK